MTSKVGLISLPFSGSYYRTKSRAFSDKRLINWYVNYPDEPGINEYQLLPCPGIAQSAETNQYFCAGSYVMNGKLYSVVRGGRLDRLDYVSGDFVSTDVGGATTIVGASSRVVMAAIKNQLVIVVPGVAGYHYTEGGSLVQITDPNFLIPETVVAIDSYFVFIQSGTNVVFHSNLNNGLAYSALDAYIVSPVQTAVGLIVYRNQLYVMGNELIVPFSNQAQAQFAFRPIQNASMDYGLEGLFLSIKVRSGIVFVGRSVDSTLSVWLYSSGAPVKISTQPIDTAINAAIDSMGSAFLMRYTQPGTECVTLSFGSGSTGYCFVYDFIASSRSGKPEWHERREKRFGDSLWGVVSIINCYGRTAVFNGASGDVSFGVMDENIGTEFGDSVRRVLNTQPYTLMGTNTKVSALEVYTDCGVDDESNLTISWSDDGGFNYGNKLSRSTGGLGEYGRRLVWNQLGGFSRQRMFQIEYTGEYPRAINKLMANIQ